MEETPIFDFPFPESTDKPDGAEQIELAVKAVEERLAMIEKLLGTPAEPAEPKAGQLIVVNGTDDPVYRAITGDVGFNSAGVATIGEERVATTMIKNLAVTAAKIANETITLNKISPFFILPAGNIGGEAVTEAKLAALAVTTAKLANEAVETGKIKALAVTEAKLAAEAVTTAKIKDGAVTDTKLASPTGPIYRSLLFTDSFLSEDAAAATYILGSGQGRGMASNGSNLVTSTTPSPPALFYFDDADYAVAGKTQKLRLRAQVVCNATKAALKFTFRLFPVTAAGGADQVILNLGASVEGSAVEINEPAASTISQAAGADFATPADGAYVLGVQTSAVLTNNSAVMVSAQLQSHYV